MDDHRRHELARQVRDYYDRKAQTDFEVWLTLLEPVEAKFAKGLWHMAHEPRPDPNEPLQVRIARRMMENPEILDRLIKSLQEEPEEW